MRPGAESPYRMALNMMLSVVKSHTPLSAVWNSFEASRTTHSRPFAS